MNTAAASVKGSTLIAQSDGSFTVNVGDGKILSIQPDGTFQSRNVNQIGPWERGWKVGNNKLSFEDTAYPTGQYTILITNR